MATVSLTIPAATALALLSCPAALAQVIPLDPLSPDAVSFHSLENPGYRLVLPISPGPSTEANCNHVNDSWRLNEHWSFNLGARYDEAQLPDGIYTVTVDVGDCHSSGTFAHTGRSWFAMLPGPRGGAEGEDGDEGSGGSSN